VFAGCLCRALSIGVEVRTRSPFRFEGWRGEDLDRGGDGMGGWVLSDGWMGIQLDRGKGEGGEGRTRERRRVSTHRNTVKRCERCEALRSECASVRPCCSAVHIARSPVGSL
jgi:hypothetical protein